MVFTMATWDAVPAAGQNRASGPSIETPVQQAIVIDGETGSVLFEKNADQPFPPASLAKLMTVEIALQALETGQVTPATDYPVSENAWRTGGAPSRTATMFAEVRSRVPVEALIQGIMVQQANDAAIVLAEGLEGGEGPFAARMNERAGELGLTASRFVNATGLPADGQETTVRDIAILSRHIEATYPREYTFFAQPDFEWNRIRQRNRNPLLHLDIGATGLATGFAEGYGFALAGAIERDDRKTIVAVAGASSDAERQREARRLLDWSQDAFSRKLLFSQGDEVGSAQVFGGTVSSVPVVVSQDFVAYVPHDATERLRAVVVYEGPLRAPVSQGQRVGRIELRIAERVSLSQDVFAGEDVPEGAFASRAAGAIRELAFGWARAL